MDANVWISALLGPASALGSKVEGWSLARRVVSSPGVVEEVLDVLRRPKFSRRLSVQTLESQFALAIGRALLLDPPPLPTPVCRDPDDDHVLALALHANAGWIVTGDRDLLVLDPWEGVRIVTPGDVE